MFRTYVKKSFNGTLVSTQKRNTCEKNQGKKKNKIYKIHEYKIFISQKESEGGQSYF